MTMALAAVPHQTLQLVATGVDDFVANEMRLSNVVETVDIYDADRFAVARKYVSETLFFLLRGYSPTDQELNWEILEEKLERIQKNELRLIEIRPVYGASVLILAEQFEIQRNQESPLTSPIT